MFLAFFAFRAGYRRFRGIEGIGLGDVKLAAVAGVWLDWVDLPVAVDIAASPRWPWRLFAGEGGGPRHAGEAAIWGVLGAGDLALLAARRRGATIAALAEALATLSTGYVIATELRKGNLASTHRRDVAPRRVDPRSAFARRRRAYDSNSRAALRLARDAARLSHTSACTQSIGTPKPLSNRRPSRNCAVGSPCWAASLSQAAAAGSCAVRRGHFGT